MIDIILQVKVPLMSINEHFYRKIEQKWGRMTVRWRKSDKFVTIYLSWKSGKMDPAREVFLDLEPGAKWRHPRNRVDRMKCDAFR